MYHTNNNGAATIQTQLGTKSQEHVIYINKFLI